MHGHARPKTHVSRKPHQWLNQRLSAQSLKHCLVLSVMGILAGGFQYLSYAPRGWWAAAWLGLALLMIALLRARTWKAGVLVGFCWGFATSSFSLPWIGSFVGIFPYVALSIVLGFMSLPATLAMWAIARSKLPFALRLIGMSAALVAGEALVQRWPFGGFPWLRVAWGQVDGPLAHATAMGGPAFVSFLTACSASCLVALATRTFTTAACFIVGTLIFGFVMPTQLQPLPEANPAGNIRVAVVQGNVPRMGLEFNAQRRAVLQNHADATNELAKRVRQGIEPKPDIVLWPENSADVSPFRDEKAARIIDQTVNNIGVPIVVGTFTYTAGTQNTMVVWNPQTGPGDRHEKIYLQPFGETMPYRDILRHFSSMVDYAGNMTPGNGTAVVTAPGTGGLKEIRLGLATCYEVVFDGAFRNAVENGATVLATPTNNATFGFTDMTYQQLAMSRMRAMEFQRATAVAATSGVSAIVDAHGDVVTHSEIFEQKVLTATLPQYAHRTWASRYEVWIEVLLSAFGILCVVGAVCGRRNHTFKRDATPATEPGTRGKL